jgi:amino acid permease
MTRPVPLIAALLGLICLIAAVMYFTMNASSLPGFFPGYEAAASDHHHYTHGIAALVVAVVLFAFAWFQSKPKRA